MQTFLPSNDAGRDGAFLGTWDGLNEGESTIQCKFTSRPGQNLSLSLLKDELPKAQKLAAAGLANSYIILTNYGVTGSSEIKIKKAFLARGVGVCRVFHRDWIIKRIQDSPRLRMMMPRLYGFADLTNLLDARAYNQAKLILSEMGDNLQKIVVTEAHRKSVRAIDEHNLVLLLGAPAAGKSTIGASLALGANDRWKCLTIKSTSPEHLQKHLDHNGGQFFWIDDAWGSTQYQRDRTEDWNQVFPLMQAALNRGTRFLFTSRDYIWNAAKFQLKLQSLPALKLSQVVINVHELSIQEKARILYNHIKLGDQPFAIRQTLKPFLPAAAEHADFLPETARRIGSNIFTKNLNISKAGIDNYFSHPQEFLEETIENLSDESKAAIALIFLNGGKIRSPVSTESLSKPSSAFGVTKAKLKEHLSALDGSFLKGTEDEEGPFWTYRHPTISDAFASYVAKDRELVEIYLSGAKPENIVREVTASGITVAGAKVIVPNSLHELLIDRIGSLPSYQLASFISYRANKLLNKKLLRLRPDILDRLNSFFSPLRDDIDTALFARLHHQGLITEERRRSFVETVRTYAVEMADDSFLVDEDVGGVLTDDERSDVLAKVEDELLENIPIVVEKLKDKWDPDYDPSDYFDELESSVSSFINELSDSIDAEKYKRILKNTIEEAVEFLEENYEPKEKSNSTELATIDEISPLGDLFRDVDK